VTDEEFLRALESCALPASQFSHASHVRAAYLYLRDRDFATGLLQLSSAIRAFAGSLGAPGRYHETITVAFAALIHQHIEQRGDGGGWQGFERENPELFERDLLLQFYSPSELESVLARRIFLLPRPRSIGQHGCVAQTKALQ
jgi:hypothetical protein